MDQLDTAPATATHTLNYSVPWICRVTNEDFQWISKVDINRFKLYAYGRLPFRKTSPYPNPVPLTGYFPPRPQMGEEDAVGPTPLPEFQGVVENVHPSVQDWLDPPATSSKPPISIESLPEDYQVLLAEHNSLVEKDFDEIGHVLAYKKHAASLLFLSDHNKVKEADFVSRMYLPRRRLLRRWTP